MLPGPDQVAAQLGDQGRLTPADARAGPPRPAAQAEPGCPRSPGQIIRLSAMARPSEQRSAASRTAAPRPLCRSARLSACGGSGDRDLSGGQPRAQQLLAHLGALAAVRLRLAEQVGHLGVALAVCVLDVGLQPQRVAQARLDVPDQVLVLVLRPGHGAGFLSRRDASPSQRAPALPAGARSCVGFTPYLAVRDGR
jgi:hypothetical protein